MSKIKTTLLSTIACCSLLTMGITTAHAEQQQPASQMKVGFYAEVGGNIGLSDVFHAKTDGTEFTIKNPGASPAGGAGVRIKTSGTSVTVGLDMSYIEGETEYVGTGFNSLLNGPMGNLEMPVFLVKISGEHNLNSHNAFYFSLGVGGGDYLIGEEKDGKKVRYTSENTSLAYSVGAGYKVYFGDNKGLFLRAGLQYTGVLNDNLAINTDLGDVSLKGGFGTGQIELKLGYQF